MADNQTQSPAVTLTVAYSTLATRVTNIQLPPISVHREILIIVQNPGGHEYSKPQPRSDLKLIELSSSGVAKSRNEAIRQATGRYLVFADDDIQFDLAALDEIVEHLQTCTCSLVLGQASDFSGKLRKQYPQTQQWLTRFNSARAATYEMLLDVAAIRLAGVRFDENFGAGAENYLGDEYIFICDMLDHNLRAHSLPITMAKHPEVSSGSGWGTKRDLRARAKVFSRIFGPAAFVVRAVFIWRNRDKISGISDFIRFVFAWYSRSE